MSGYGLWVVWGVIALLVVVGGIKVRARLNRVERGADQAGRGRERHGHKHGARPE